MEKITTKVAEFGFSLNFNFVEDSQYTYPSITLQGYQGTVAELFGQHMEPKEIEELGTKLIRFAQAQERKHKQA